ncbi:MAG: DUF2027 domain-containing protein [Bacteroidetes bacterium]|nr:DUF2027 domain-containing protein [Bacteroidota bacterium]
MKFKIGDKVSFLNEKRNGVIAKIINSNMVTVLTDGFEISVMERELILEKTFYQSVTQEREEKERIAIQEAAAVEMEEETSFEGLDLIHKSSLKRGIYIAFIPENENDSVSGTMDVTLINHTSFDAIFSYSLLENGKFVAVAFDKAEPESKYLLEKIDASQIQKWSQIMVQSIFFKEESSDSQNPIVKEFKIKPARFYNQSSFKLNKLIGSNCILLGEDQVEEEPEEVQKDIETPSKLKIVGHLKDFNKTDNLIAKHTISKGIAEVDLHIDELVDSIEGKNNLELLTIQLQYFQDCLEACMAKRFSKVIFIHGVGNGKLKTELRQILKDSYPKFPVYDASMAKYGVGATEVVIYQNFE